MNLTCVGINHRTAPIEIREKLWFSSDEAHTSLPILKNNYAKECILISTCNRTEFYYVPVEQKTNGQALWQVLAKLKNAPGDVNEQHFYELQSLKAANHFFNVATGIDSMVLGDVQILNQIKEAFAIARETKSSGIILNRLFNTALHTGKRAKTETEISHGAVSISYAAAELASKIFSDLSTKTALLIGAGETGTLTAQHLVSRNLGKLLIANRTRSKAEEIIKQLNGSVVEFENFRSELQHVDVIISSVEAPHHILTASDIREAMNQRKSKPLFIIDIGVPRNIDPTANNIGNVFLHDIDTLNQIVDHNLERRKAEIPNVQRIVLQELIQFKSWYDSLQVSPTIQELQQQFESIRKSEIDKYRHHFTEGNIEQVEMLTQRIVNKILHTPFVSLKEKNGEYDEEDVRTKVHFIRSLFGLDKRKSDS